MNRPNGPIEDAAECDVPEFDDELKGEALDRSVRTAIVGHPVPIYIASGPVEFN